ncbi:hypothetical protein TTHERM_00115390 (macronuclear) [Tetrahymena thermophila SB210]|uniref:CHY zinc finger protein n=1 Tax=Tetrahymena thermophila (strain SB210) TaxID=312017 RepID=Q22Z30_TETTS|nr:hypothetical protein TTHERM_00115390 [Tetrahymena thermophila SB210]EAR90491.2 hypothetical protein TTHERM_00115390 [Tetrahymena thermophila SB210]|eukprot:XP_001010736.2 hypothetical protein TTHERM_00115390 [Tetrahymena thermophila SB210]
MSLSYKKQNEHRDSDVKNIVSQLQQTQDCQDKLNMSFSPNDQHFEIDQNQISSNDKSHYSQLSPISQNLKKQELDDYTNQYLNQFQSPNQRSSPEVIRNTNSSQNSMKRNFLGKQCSSNYISQEISTPTDKLSRQSHIIFEKSPQEASQSKQSDSVLMRSSTKQSQMDRSFSKNSIYQQRPQSSLNSSEFYMSKSLKDKYFSPQKQTKLNASSLIPLSNTEIIGSISCSTILNKSTSLLNRSTNSMNKSTASLNKSTVSNKNNLNQQNIIQQKSMKQSQKLNNFDDILKKSALNRLGLTLKPVCSAHKHQQLKYICVDQKCLDKERVLCEKCISSFDHEFHDLKTIEEFILQLESSYETFLRKFFHFKSIKEELEHPSFLGNINQLINQIKEQICQNLDEIKDKIQNQYQIILQQMDKEEKQQESEEQRRKSKIQDYSEIKYVGGYLQQINNQQIQKDRFQQGQSSSHLKVSADGIEQEIERLEKIDQFMQSIVQKNFFDLTKKEINMSLGLVSRSHYLKIDQLHNTLSTKYNKLENTFNEAVYQYTQKLQLALKEVFNNHTDFKIPLPDQYSPTQIKNDLVNQYQQLELEIKYKKKQLKLAKQNIIQQDQARTQNKLLKRIEPTFPYNTYNNNCYHLTEAGIICNTTPIFECCQQAYQCVQCHYKFCKHQPKITNPSKRYCMKCLSVFKVDFPTDVSINCDDCIKKQQEQNEIS